MTIVGALRASARPRLPGLDLLGVPPSHQRGATSRGSNRSPASPMRRRGPLRLRAPGARCSRSGSPRRSAARPPCSSRRASPRGIAAVADGGDWRSAVLIGAIGAVLRAVGAWAGPAAGAAARRGPHRRPAWTPGRSARSDPVRPTTPCCSAPTVSTTCRPTAPPGFSRTRERRDRPHRDRRPDPGRGLAERRDHRADGAADPAVHGPRRPAHPRPGRLRHRRAAAAHHPARGARGRHPGAGRPRPARRAGGGAAPVSDLHRRRTESTLRVVFLVARPRAGRHRLRRARRGRRRAPAAARRPAAVVPGCSRSCSRRSASACSASRCRLPCRRRRARRVTSAPRRS